MQRSLHLDSDSAPSLQILLNFVEDVMHHLGSQRLSTAPKPSPSAAAQNPRKSNERTPGPLVFPALVPYWESIQGLAIGLPLGHVRL